MIDLLGVLLGAVFLHIVFMLIAWVQIGLLNHWLDGGKPWWALSYMFLTIVVAWGILGILSLGLPGDHPKTENLE